MPLLRRPPSHQRMVEVRPSLRGQRGLFATCFIKKNTFIPWSEYDGMVITWETAKRATSEERSHMLQLINGMFVIDGRAVTQKDEVDPNVGLGAFVNMSQFSNVTLKRKSNDKWRYAEAELIPSRRGTGDYTMLMCTEYYIMQATRDIEPGDELLLHSYGPMYDWGDIDPTHADIKAFIAAKRPPTGQIRGPNTKRRELQAASKQSASLPSQPASPASSSSTESIEVIELSDDDEPTPAVVPAFDEPAKSDCRSFEVAFNNHPAEVTDAGTQEASLDLTTDYLEQSPHHVEETFDSDNDEAACSSEEDAEYQRDRFEGDRQDDCFFDSESDSQWSDMSCSASSSDHALEDVSQIEATHPYDIDHLVLGNPFFEKLCPNLSSSPFSPTRLDDDLPRVSRRADIIQHE